MTPETFEERIRQLDQVEVLTGAISSLNKLLVDKNLATKAELQKYFLDWLKAHRRPRVTKRRSGK